MLRVTSVKKCLSLDCPSNTEGSCSYESIVIDDSGKCYDHKDPNLTVIEGGMSFAKPREYKDKKTFLLAANMLVSTLNNTDLIVKQMERFHCFGAKHAPAVFDSINQSRNSFNHLAAVYWVYYATRHLNPCPSIHAFHTKGGFGNSPKAEAFSYAVENSLSPGLIFAFSGNTRYLYYWDGDKLYRVNQTKCLAALEELGFSRTR